MKTISQISSLTLWIIKGNYLGFVGCALIFGSIWLDAEKQTIPQDILILGCSLCLAGLLSHIMFLFTKEAKETIWKKGGLLALAVTPAPWRGIYIGSLGLILCSLGFGLFWLELHLAFILFLVGWLIGILGGYNHVKWMFRINK